MIRVRGAWRRRLGLALLWLVALAIYGLYFQGQWVFGERPIVHITGDEPHYLVIATSLLRDGDLDVLNNYREKDYQPFYPYHLGDARSPEDMHALYGQDGRLYSKHSVGLPLLILPAMRLGGHGLVLVFMMAVTATLALQTFLLAWEVSEAEVEHGERGSRLGPALMAWAAVAFTSPLLLYADQVYPEVPGALLVVFGLRAVLRARRPGHSEPSAGAALRLGLAVGLLPWLHLRYIPLAAVLGVAGLIACLPAWRRLAPWLLAPPFVAGLALWLFDWRLFGGLPAVDEYGSFAPQNVLTGTPGLLFDQQFGLLVYAPVYLIAGFGLPLVWRRLAGLRGAAILATLGCYALFVAAFSYWYGAYSPPSRMLVPVVPLLVVPLVLALQSWRRPAFRLVTAGLFLLSLSIAHLLMDVPRLRYNERTGKSEMLAYLSATWGRDLNAFLPSFLFPTPAAYAWALVAVLLAVVLYLALTGEGLHVPRRMAPRQPRPAPAPPG